MASTNVGSIHYDLDLNTSAFDRAMAGVSGKLTSVGKTMSNVGSTMTAMVTLPIVAGAAYAVKAASDLNETMNKVEVAFKDNAKEVLDWSKTSIKSMGLARQSALDAAALFGDMGTSMGLSTKEASKMSMSMVQLGADLASFKNIPIAEAQTALAGVFTGETESLKRLGIVMTETNLLEFARAKGITKTMQEMTQAEKVQLRYQYIMDKTKNSQGDFIRTSEGTANQIRMTQERFKELSATIGTKLLPIANKLLGFINDLFDAFGKLSPKQQDMILMFIGVAAAIGPILFIGGKLLTLFGLIAAHPVIAAIALLAAGLVYLQLKFQTFDPIIKAVSDVLNVTLIPMFKILWDIIQNKVIPAFQELWAKHGKELTTLFNFLGGSVLFVIIAMLVQFTAVVIALAYAFATLISWLTQGISWLKNFGDNMESLGSRTMTQARQMGSSLAEFSRGVGASLGSAINHARNFIGNLIGTFSSAGSWLYNAGIQVVQGLIRGVQAAYGHAVAYVRGLGDSIKSNFRAVLSIKSPSKVFQGYGKNITDGLVIGMEKGMNAIDNQVASLIPRDISLATSPNQSPVNNSNTTINIGTIQDRQDADRIIRHLDNNQILSTRGGSQQWAI